MTRDTEKCPLSVLTDVRIKQVNFRENMSFLSGKNETVHIKRVSVQRGSTVLKHRNLKHRSTRRVKHLSFYHRETMVAIPSHT